MNLSSHNPAGNATQSDQYPHIAPKIAPGIETEGRAVVDTACAAFWLNRKPQTLRIWACYENGPIRPIRIHGRLAWPVSELRKLINQGN